MSDATVVVGYDGTPQSRAAVEWASREAERRGLPLELLHAGTAPDGAEHVRAERLLEVCAQELGLTHPEVPLTVLDVGDPPVAALIAAAGRGSLLVLGSRGLGALRGFVVGSVSQDVLARGACPAVLVRAASAEPPEGLPDGGGAPGVVAGVDLRYSADVLDFACKEAELRALPLHVVHTWGPPPGSEYVAFGTVGAPEDELAAAEAAGLDAAVDPWRRRYPAVPITTTLARGHAAIRLVDAATGARLLVVGRRHRGPRAAPRLGPVAHAAIHHTPSPVAIVPEGTGQE
ncbi:universal stress protein [Actinacidiphila guanduensis]|uniref:Nucleotide-binding universal stress protein, UspA family n=1 Tax=Actinacidiphila guanduensis TaxID=310781 RepID=A0A1H0BE25_9ACTN|nr:universal stress protein [Actinacidiphila guanduensis]SDN43866.1 Nucleotide-binding universal stress protein, UspA family [Actinacidiphila guanduensis]